MFDPNDWRDPKKLVQHLASELLRGRLALLLGAGVSTDFGLPNWTTLVNSVSEAVGLAQLSAGDNPTDRMERIKNEKFRNDSNAYLSAIQSALYKGTKLINDDEIDFERIRSNRLLAAIGALVMSSRRGSASKVVTFNFDDLLEIYLEFHGFVAASIASRKHWAGNHDVTVYHPHGLLPLTPDRKWGEEIVFGSSEFFDIMADSGNEWRSLLRSLLRTHTTIQIGLSGYDDHLKLLMSEVKKAHATSTGRDRIWYHGVRFSTTSAINPDMISSYEGWGVHTHAFDNYSELPTFLFEICQQARKMRIAADRL